MPSYSELLPLTTNTPPRFTSSTEKTPISLKTIAKRSPGKRLSYQDLSLDFAPNDYMYIDPREDPSLLCRDISDEDWMTSILTPSTQEEREFDEYTCRMFGVDLSWYHPIPELSIESFTTLMITEVEVESVCVVRANIIRYCAILETPSRTRSGRCYSKPAPEEECGRTRSGCIYTKC
jgi:hypothetical protein